MTDVNHESGKHSFFTFSVNDADYEAEDEDVDVEGMGAEHFTAKPSEAANTSQDIASLLQDLQTSPQHSESDDEEDDFPFDDGDEDEDFEEEEDSFQFSPDGSTRDATNGNDDEENDES